MLANGTSVSPCGSTVHSCALAYFQLLRGISECTTFPGTQIEYLNKEVRGRQHRKEDENFLTVNIDIAALKNESAHPDVRLRLLDTPGPNEAGEDALK